MPPLITLTIVSLAVAATFFQFGILVGRQKQKKLDTASLGKVTANFGGIYKIIDEYREMLVFFKAHCPGAEEAVQGAFWIRRIIAQHDQMLHQLLPLIDKNSRDKSRTGVVRNLPFCEVEWEGLTEVIRRCDEQRLAKIVEKASCDCWSPSLSESDISRAMGDNAVCPVFK